jgi:hypothetical protein
VLEKIIGTEIVVAHRLTKDEADDLVAKEEVASLATKQFIAGEISLSDFLECMELAGVEVDNFLVVADQNAQVLGF